MGSIRNDTILADSDTNEGTVAVYLSCGSIKEIFRNHIGLAFGLVHNSDLHVQGLAFAGQLVGDRLAGPAN